MSDLVRGIRARPNKEDENAFISACLQEIKNELATNDANLQANAVQKLCYVCLYNVFTFLTELAALAGLFIELGIVQSAGGHFP